MENPIKMDDLEVPHGLPFPGDWNRSLEDANACLVLLPEHAKFLDL